MYVTETRSWSETDLQAPRRNHYFHGKLMDAYHFELETNYFNAKRWLMNHLVLGSGVVCGLDVVPKGSGKIGITAGVAIDGHGREIIVPSETSPLEIPRKFMAGAKAPGEQSTTRHAGHEHGPSTEEEEAEDEDETWIHVVICYHECLEDPMPVLAGDCHGPQSCQSGTVREWYSIFFRDGKLDPIDLYCQIEDLLGPRKVNYRQLVEWVTSNPCSELPRDPCIPLANIRISASDEHPCHVDDIDIAVRPIVYTNLVLFEMLLDLVAGWRQAGPGSRARG